MAHPPKLLLSGVLLALSFAPQAMASPPAVNLTVSLRHVELPREQAVVISTDNPQRPLLSGQQLRVRNGGRAQFRMDQAVPLQWVTAGSGYRTRVTAEQGTSATVTGSAAVGTSAQVRGRSEGGSFQQETVWLQTGQSLSVQPLWAGGSAPVEITVDLQQSNLGPGTSTMTPRQNATQVATSVYAALGEWVTIASTGSPSSPGTVSTRAVREAPRALQLRVTAD